MLASIVDLWSVSSFLLPRRSSSFTHARVGWTRMHTLEHARTCHNFNDLHISPSPFPFSFPVTFTIPLTFLPVSSLRSVLLMRFMWTALIYRAIMSSSQAQTTVQRQHRICGHNNKYMSNILLEAKATPAAFVCAYTCLHLARYSLHFVIEKFQEKCLSLLPITGRISLGKKFALRSSELDLRNE